MRHRSVVVENEEHSLSRLRRLLAEFPNDVEVIGEAVDGPSAVQLITAHEPDLVFLDIDLPGLNGFEVLEELDCEPAVIFTTAFNQHALQAFKVNAVDYLLKPIDEKAMATALEKLQVRGFDRGHFVRALQQIASSLGSRYLTRLSCRLGNRTVLLKIGEVVYFRSDSKYTSVHTANHEYLIDTPLIDLERRLDPKDFVRIHRSTLVNLGWVSEFRRNYDGRLKVILSDPQGTELSASRSYADNLKNL